MNTSYFKGIVAACLFAVVVSACSTESGDAGDGVPGHCFESSGGNCMCHAGETASVGWTATSSCAATSDRICCAAPFEGSGEPWSQCSCYPGNSSCNSLVEVDRCDGATYHPSTGGGSCDQCSYDSDCDYGCASSERGVCSRVSGCGSCSCQ